MNDEYLNRLINEEMEYSNKLESLYHYPSNITHLLYIIIPAFIIKYGTNNKQLIEKCFIDVPIKIDDKKDERYQAYYLSKPSYQNNEIVTSKKIVLSNYEGISLMQLLENLIHEYNHALNSIQNEIIVDNYVNIRTGISYNTYDKKTLKYLYKSDEIILEEVINTKQTSLIIDIIKDFNNYNINNSTITSTLYSIYHSDYKSYSYYLESYVCKELMNNKTFISTFEVLRFDGQIEDLHHFFDTVTGKDGSFIELAKLLNKSLELERTLSTTKFFKKMKISKIKELSQKALAIVKLFNDNSIYK